MSSITLPFETLSIFVLWNNVEHYGCIEKEFKLLCALKVGTVK